MRARGLPATDDGVTAVAAGMSAGLVACALALTLAWMPLAEVPEGWDPLLVLTWLLAPAIAGGLIVAGLVARRGSPGIAIGWFVAASWMARVAIGSLPPATTQDAPISWLWVMGLAAVAAIALILTLYAWTPRRRLGRWVLPVGLGCVGLVALAVLSELAYRAGWLTDDSGDIPKITYYSALWVDVGVPVLIPLAMAIAGALRADGRTLAGGAVPARVAWIPPVPMIMGRRIPVFLILLLASVAALAATTRWPRSELFSGSMFELILWPVAAAVAWRWSHVVGWTLLAVAYAAAAVAPFRAAIERSGVLSTDVLWGDPGLAATSGRPLLVAVVLTTVSVGIGWTVLALVRPRVWVVRAALVAVATHLVVGLLVAGSGLVLLFGLAVVDLPVAPLGLDLPLLAVVPMGMAGIALIRARLIAGVAEAERRRAPGFAAYIAVVARESVTGEGAVRATAVEAERVRLAADLHADILPALAQALADSESGASPDQVARRLRDLEDEVRGVLAERRLVVLEELGLIEALEWLAERAEDRTTMAIELSVDDRSSETRPPRPVERAAFRVAQLAMDNAILHAVAQHLAVDVLVRPDEVRIRIEDDGRGLEIDGAMTAARANHAGIADMRMQADGVRARVDLVPTPGGGTVVTFGWLAS